MLLRRILLSVGLLGCIGLTSHAVSISDLVDQVSEGSYSNFHVNLFVSDGQNRAFTTGSSPRTPTLEHDLARDYIVSNFTAWGYDTWLDPFSFTYSSGHLYTGCNNVVAVKRGTVGDNIYMVGAHYDSVDSAHSSVTECPGADDNASGTAALLELGNALKDFTFKDTFIILALDAEEKGFRGAAHFIDTHITTSPAKTNSTTFLKSSIQAMVNLDTIGYDDTTTSNKVVIGTHGPSNAVSFAIEQAFTNYTTLIPRNSPGYSQSDHVAFQGAGIPSVHIIEYDYEDYFDDAGINPHVHTDQDSIDSPNYMHYGYATEITKAVVGALCEYAMPILPATLTHSLDGKDIAINWLSQPEITYHVYGCGDLIASNGWSYLVTIPASSTSTTNSVFFDTDLSENCIFKVMSELE